MTRFLLATDTVHTTAAACDYLGGRLEDGDDVSALAVSGTEENSRDGEDALNVATARLSGITTVETTHAAGDPTETILDVAADVAADEVVMAAGGGAPGTGADLAGTVPAVIARAAVPVVVVPVPRLD